MDTTEINKIKLPEYCSFLNMMPGKEHYKLLAYLSTLYNDIEIFDIGTCLGYSALALAHNPKNKVLSFDIARIGSLPTADNITYYLENVLTPEGKQTWGQRILASPLIFFDIAPHVGFLEYEFYIWLRDNNYQGLLVCDDIHYFEEMKENFWNKVDDRHKIDISRIGHWSGTGLIYFNENSVPKFLRY
jgi:hypothetical protein